MTRKPRFPLILLLAGISSAAIFKARGDVIVLKNGGEIRGKIEPDEADDPENPEHDELAAEKRLTIRTITGGRVTVRQGDIRFVTERPLLVEEFETRLRRLPADDPDDLDALRRLAAWCRENRLRDQRKSVLERIVESAPDDEEARAGLGQSLYDGQWMTRDAWMRSQGYIKHRGDYVTQQELDLIRKTEAERKAEKEWYPKVRLWLTWAEGRNRGRRDEGLANLGRIDDPAAVAALNRFLSDHADREVRLLYVRILNDIPGVAPVRALVEKSLLDADYELRWNALNALDPEQYPAAMPLYAQSLGHDLNVVVRRAGKALDRIGDERIIPQLIQGLVTSHKYRVQVPVNNAISFNTNGSFSLGGAPGVNSLPPELESMLLKGRFPNGVIVLPTPRVNPVRTRVVTIRVNQQNPEVLAALQRIAGNDLGYDGRAWQLWWTTRKTQLGGPPLP